MKTYFLLLVILMTTIPTIAQDNCNQLKWEELEDLGTYIITAERPARIDKRTLKRPDIKHLNQPSPKSNSDQIVSTDTLRLPGEISDFRAYLEENLDYPLIAVEAEIQGKVWVSFEVDQDGYTRHVQIKRGVSKFTDSEVRSTLMKTPKMKHLEGHRYDNGLPPGCYGMSFSFKLI